ncbi:LytR/AlgR family response regulator transcription factor [Pedobacter duraquae]|uniref:LytTR family two component transcriptional regulator n=1 Tax=Pedobacter duraquae TaxID=425511 RepID=A0A4R6ILA8_9SPHI|nr:LytTR family DNA-binding domain-containing protein [Pedobacter duraquae]TDO22735.1 LytTR family two component transcriptional regulator [Pedobacter duraquae]
MIIAIAIDDEPKALEVIKFHCAKIERLDLIAQFSDPAEAIVFLRQNPVDLIFLDINMPNISGLEMLEELKLKPNIIFTTAYTNFAFESYAHNAIDYLLKPFEFDRFQMAVDKLEERMSFVRNKNTFFFIKDGFQNIKIQFKEILFIKGSGNYLDIILKEKVHSPRMTFMELVEKLPSSEFIRVHQSYIVNINTIEKIETNHVYIDKYEIPISGRYRDLFFKRLNLTK